MLDLKPVAARGDITRRVRIIVAEQLAMDSFQVKESDSIDETLGIAGDDVEEIFASVTREFGTDFTDLGAYFELYFRPEVSSMPYLPATLLLLSALVGVSYSALHLRSPRTVNIVTLPVAALLIVLIWRGFAKHHAKQYYGKKLTFTVQNIVDAVIAGKWTPPEDIWQQIERLGQKKPPYTT